MSRDYRVKREYFGQADRFRVQVHADQMAVAYLYNPIAEWRPELARQIRDFQGKAITAYFEKAARNWFNKDDGLRNTVMHYIDTGVAPELREEARDYIEKVTGWRPQNGRLM